MHANKLIPNIIIVTLYILILIGCTSQKMEQPAPIASATLTTLLPTTTSTIIPTDAPLPISTLTPTISPTLTPSKPFNNNVEKGDYLIYRLVSGELSGKLFFYDPATDIHIPILPEWDISSYAISINDKLAFSAANGEKTDIYILDYPFWGNSPVTITSAQDIKGYPHSWSPDGNYLLLGLTSNGNKFLAVWDGFEFYPIHEFAEDTRFGSYESDWSQDGKFAFAIYSNYNNGDVEIYAWYGDPDASAFNVSQNPSGQDRYPVWSPQGDLAFLSSEKMEDDSVFKIIVWKEHSINKGSLDGSPIKVVAPESLKYTSVPSWSNKGILVFQAAGGIIYEWDGQQTTPMQNIQNYGFWGYWGPNGYWATISGYPESHIYIYNEKNETILKTEGGYNPAWSPEGLLVFCDYDHAAGSFIISIWNGLEITEIIKYKGYIQAEWRNGDYVYCSNG